MASAERYRTEYAYTGGPPKAEDAQKTAGEAASAAKGALPEPPKDVPNPFQGFFGGAGSDLVACTLAVYPQCTLSVQGPWCDASDGYLWHEALMCRELSFEVFLQGTVSHRRLRRMQYLL